MTDTRPSSSSSAGRTGVDWTRRQWLGAMAGALGLAGCAKLEKIRDQFVPDRGEITILIWEGYFSAAIFDGFRRRTGIRVTWDSFETNDDLPYILNWTEAKYDLVMPSAFMVESLRAQGLLRPFRYLKKTDAETIAQNLQKQGLMSRSQTLKEIHASKMVKGAISYPMLHDYNLLQHLDPLDPLSGINRQAYNPWFDLTNEYVVPYIWGSTGIGFSSNRIEGIPSSWGDLFWAHVRQGAAPRISVLNEARFTLENVVMYLEGLAAVLKEDGWEGMPEPEKTFRMKQVNEALLADWSRVDHAERIRRAGEKLIALRDVVGYRFRSNSVAADLAEGKTDVAMAWSADVMRAIKGPPPMEGTLAVEEEYKERGRVAYDSGNNRVVWSPVNEDEERSEPNVVQKKETLTAGEEDSLPENFSSNEKIRVALPREGAIIFKDSFAIPKSVRPDNQIMAEAFIAYLLDPLVAARVTNWSLYPTTVEAAIPFVDRDILNGPSYFQHPAGMTKNVSLEDLVNQVDDQGVYQKVWDRVTTATPQGPTIAIPTPTPAAKPAGPD